MPSLHWSVAQLKEKRPTMNKIYVNKSSNLKLRGRYHQILHRPEDKQNQSH